MTDSNKLLDISNYFPLNMDADSFVIENSFGVLVIKRKRSCTCHTYYHTDLKGLFLGHFYFYDRYNDSDSAKQMVDDWAEKLQMTPDEMMKKVRLMYETILKNTPEKFI